MVVLTSVLVLVLAAISVLFFNFRRDTPRQTLPAPRIGKETIMALARVYQTATRDGRIQWQLEAESAELEEMSGRMVLKSPKVDFFLEDGSKVRMTSEKGILYTNTNDMEACGHVQLSHDRYTMSTEMLAYRHERRILESDQPVRILGEAFDLRADTMVYDLNTDQARFNGQVQGEVLETIPLS